jgi:hypothetical protein
MKKRLYMSAVAAAVAGAFAVVMVAPASAAPGLLTPSTHHVNCGAQPVTAGSVFCEEVSFANFTAIDLRIVAIEVADRNGPSQDFFTQPVLADPCFEGLTLPPVDNCSLFVFFDPSVTGHQSARLNVFDDVSDANAARIRLGGRGTD